MNFKYIYRIAAGFIFAAAFISAVQAQKIEKTVINDKSAAQKLLGRHMLSLQWISWDHFGTATITSSKGIYSVKGEQKGRGESKSDFLMIDGTISEINAKDFKFNGTVMMQISHIN